MSLHEPLEPFAADKNIFERDKATNIQQFGARQIITTDCLIRNIKICIHFLPQKSINSALFNQSTQISDRQVLGKMQVF